MAKVINTTFKLKRGTKDRWLELNPVLLEGEPGFEIDTGKLKIGNGVDDWVTLQYIGEESNGVFNASTHFDFPSVGNVNTIYKAQTEKKIYQWNPTALTYEALNESIGDIGSIEIINGGNANGTN